MSRSLFCIVLLMSLLLVPFVSATPPMAEDLYVQRQMFSVPHNICYTAQGGDAQYILQPTTYNTVQTGQNNKTNLAFQICKHEARDFRSEPSLDCIMEKESKIIALYPGETACDYSQDPELCYSCARTQKLKQDVVGIITVILFAFRIFTPPLALLYLAFVGISSLIKKRLNAPKWLFILVILLLIISVALWWLVPWPIGY
ncbi:MAG TPA: hypothetical protein VJB66_02100 [Candidatus Nanoarchaeia archaeon]|nr:hypothetical protein [Candidatus Nanoarchaeia archaeon]